MSQTPMRRKYSKEFKQDAVHLALKGEQPVTEIASDLGISPDLLYHWKHEHQKHRKEFAVRTMCRVPEVSVRSFMLISQMKCGPVI
jgi:transposase-like protein